MVDIEELDDDNLLGGEPIVETSYNPDGFFADNSDKVAVRIRPFVGREMYPRANNNAVIQSEGMKLQIGNKEFSFDRVFDTESSQDEVFETCSRNLILGCLQGYNATILAYGQTGSGKTFTMGTGSTIGLSVDQIGIVPRVFDFIFQELDIKRRQNPNSEFTLKVQFLELYGDDIHDLLDLGPIDKITGQQTKSVTIHEDKSGAIRIDGLKQEIVNSKQECIALLNKGIALRVTSSTLMNEGSSRSHAVFTITIDQKIVKVLDQEPGASGEAETSEENISAKFHFVDLAGSERIKKTGASGKQMQEGISINKGLLALGNVIAALTDEKKIAAGKQFIPYRDSKLTRILQDSLGGNSRTTMIACVSPAEINHEESLSTIKYASRARNIKNKPILNRDANSMLIESLRSQIKTMTVEIAEYQRMLKENGITLPTDFKNTIELKVSSKNDEKINELKKTKILEDQLITGSAVEIRELKIRLAKKEKELKEVLERVNEMRNKDAMSTADQSQLQNERDELVLKLEQMNELMQKNNLALPTSNIIQAPSTGGKRTQTLIDEYKAKLAKIQGESEKKNAEILAKSKKIAEMLTQMKRDEQILKKTFEENERLKKSLKDGLPSPFTTPIKKKSSKAEDVPDAETIKDQFMDKLTSQLENFFDSDNISLSLSEPSSTDSSLKSGKEPSKRQQQLQDALENVHAKQSIEDASKAVSLEDKEKLIAAVRSNVDAIKSDLGQLLKNTWAQRIQEIEQSMLKAKQERQKGIAAAAGSADKNSVIEKEYMIKMDALNKQLVEQQRDKKKKEDSVTKIMVQQEQRLKAMEIEITKMKREREELEKQKKYGEERFSKFKTTVNKDLLQSKKAAEDKTKAMVKLKSDLKKTDQLVQQKISELKGLQKQVREEKERRMKEEEQENTVQGVDIDSIKDWINMNTEQLLKQQELQVLLKQQLSTREEIEEEMLAEGDRLTELSVQESRLTFEQQLLLQARDAGEEYDEARDLEIEVELEDVATESSSIAQTLDTLDEHLQFVNEKINNIREEITDFDMDSIQPPRFKGLSSVEMARKTLRTFFMVLLDLNVYKRDLETKCIEQDEKIIDLTTQLTVLSENTRGVDRVALMRKQKAMAQLVSKIGEKVEFIDNRDTENLELTTQEQNQLTKLSLSKIVSNLRGKLKEEQSRNQSLNLKLDAVLKEKEQLKQKFVTYQREKKFVGPGPTSGSFHGTFGNPPPQLKPAVPVQPRSKTSKPDVKKTAAPTAEESPSRKHMTFRQRRDLMKESKTQEIGKTQQNVELAKQTRKRKKERAPKTNEQLVEQLSRLEDDLRINKQNAAGDERKSNKRAFIGDSGLEKNELETHMPASSFLTSPSQPETVPEMDDEEDSDDFKLDEDLLNDELQVEEVKDEKMQLLLNSGQKPQQQEADVLPEKAQIWKFEQLVGLPIEPDQSILALDAVGDRLFIMYDDLTLLEIDMKTRQLVNETNIGDLEDAAHLAGKKATSFAMFKDLNMIAVSTDECVLLFDYESELTVVTTLQIANVAQIAFIELYIVLLIESDDGSSATIACFQMDSTEPDGSITVNQFLGNKILMRQGEQSVYYATGMQIGKIAVPEMELQFQEDAGHVIQDFAVSDTCIFTTGKDSSIRVFDSENGMMLIEPMSEMECDAVAVQGYHLVARCGGGQAMFVFKYTDGNEELEEEDFIECEDLFKEIIEDPTGNARNFFMRGGLTVSLESVEYHLIVLANLTEKGLSVNMLKAQAY